MVRELRKGSNVYYICEECDLPYPDEESAKNCEEACKHHT